ALVRRSRRSERRISRRGIDRVGIGPEMREHVVAAALCPLVAERADINRRDNDPFAGTGTRFGEDPAVEINHLAAARPGVRRVVPQAGTLVRCNDGRGVLQRAATLDDRPPVPELVYLLLF